MSHKLMLWFYGVHPLRGSTYERSVDRGETEEETEFVTKSRLGKTTVQLQFTKMFLISLLPLPPVTSDVLMTESVGRTDGSV